jgi:hypothetical protein
MLAIEIDLEHRLVACRWLTISNDLKILIGVACCDILALTGSIVGRCPVPTIENTRKRAAAISACWAVGVARTSSGKAEEYDKKKLYLHPQPLTA